MNLFAFPDDRILSTYNFDEKVIFLTKKGWLLYNREFGKRIEVDFSIEFDLVGKINHIDLINNVNWWNPIYNRWTSGSFKYEDYRTDSLLIILKIYSGLVKYNITKVINFTAIPHHIDSLLLSIAAKYNNCSQIFLYANVFDGRLIPICHKGEFINRSLAFNNISSINYQDVINDFILNKSKGNPPKLNTKISLFKTNFLFASLYLIFLSFNSLLRRIANRWRKENSVFDFYEKTSFIENWGMLCSQKSYLIAFNKYKLSLKSSYDLLKSNNLYFVLAAHYQPEATSFPEGGDWSNHINIICKLKGLGIQHIAYKEHPATKLFIDNVVGMTKVGMYRSKFYFDKLKELNCVILHEAVNLSISDNLCENYLPITITGTIALERSLAGLKTIVVGEPWFKGLPGTYSFEDLERGDVIIDKVFLKKNSKLAEESFQFLLTLLNNNTIANYLGVGSGVPSNNNFDKESFLESLNNILKTKE